MLALGLPPAYILDEMEIYEAEVALGAYKFKDMSILGAIRQGAFISVSPYLSGDVDIQALMPLPFDEEREEDEEEGEPFDPSKMYELSKNIAKNINT